MTLQFKTNINCASCVRSVTNFLNEIEGITTWEVDTTHPDKILKVDGKLEASAVVEAVEDAGFDIEHMTA